MDEIVSKIKYLKILIVKLFLFFSLKDSFYLIVQKLNQNRDDSATKIKKRWLKNSTCKS